jgi:superfamily II DNA or RNA helicase
MNIILRPYQSDLRDRIRQEYKRGKRAPLVVLPTGGGKTIIFCDIAERVRANNKRAIILVHRAELMRQTSEHLIRLGVPHGLIAPGKTTSQEPIQVASVQTLTRRLDRTPTPDLIIIDECHHALAKSWQKIIDKFSKSRLLGVTATPIRLDGQGLGKSAEGCFDSLLEGPTVKQLIRDGYLSQPIVYGPPVGIDLSSVKITRGDYDQKQSEIIVDKPKITGCVISHYQRLGQNMPAICFCVTVKHAEDVAAEFNAAGIPAAHLHGGLSAAVRKYRVEGLASGVYKVLTSCDIVSEGTDIPVVGCAILLRPTQSFGLCRQQIGRALRPYKGKTAAIIIDHVGNCLRLGLPDDDVFWTLDGQKKKSRRAAEAVSKYRTCNKCYAVFGCWMIRCPQCGHDVETQGREIDIIDGELELMAARQADEKREKRREQGRAQTLEDLIRVGRERGYSHGWAYLIWNKRKHKKQRRPDECELNIAV